MPVVAGLWCLYIAAHCFGTHLLKRRSVLCLLRPLTIRLDERQLNQLEVIARVEGVTVAEQVRDAVALLVDAKRTNKRFIERVSRLLEQDRTVLRDFVDSPDGSERTGPDARAP